MCVVRVSVCVCVIVHVYYANVHVTCMCMQCAYMYIRNLIHVQYMNQTSLYVY